MLYPIELLRHKAGGGRHAAEGGHVNQREGICHAVDRAFCPSQEGLWKVSSCILQ